jgi:hypothetical protein
LPLPYFGQMLGVSPERGKVSSQNDCPQAHAGATSLTGHGSDDSLRGKAERSCQSLLEPVRVVRP